MYKNRLKVFMAIILAGLLALAARIGQLQIVRGERYRADWERSMRELRLLPAPRGQITDRAGYILAADVPCQDFCLDYRFMTGEAKWVAQKIRRIERAEGLSPQEANEAYEARAQYTWRLADQLSREANADLPAAVERVLAGVRRIRMAMQRRGTPDSLRLEEEQEAHPVVPSLDESAAVVAAADIRAGRTVGAALRNGHKRVYPYGETACQLIGVTGLLNAAELARRNDTLGQADRLTRKRQAHEADESAGLGGVESLAEPMLRGTRGYRVLDTGGREDVEIESDPPSPGADAHLTLDVRLQQAVENRIRQTGHNGSAVVLLVDHSQVLASASVPTYDLNRYREEIGRLMADSRDTPLLNRAVAGRYPPGSSIKPVVALAALSQGRIAPGTQYQCDGYLHAHSQWMGKCTGTHGSLDLHHAIMKSCNVYFYHVGERCGLPLLSEWFERFGLDSPPGAGLPEEKAGHIAAPLWIADPRNRAALASEAMQEGIGQGMLWVTPMHMAGVAAAIARGGRWEAPMLVVEAVNERPAPRDLGIAAANLQAVRDGMKAVVNTEGGTGYRAFHAAGLPPLDVEACGKSGTAEVPPQRADMNDDGRAGPEEIVREGKIVWFIGFAPAQRPKIAFAVMLEYVVEGSGGATAAPVARDIIQWCKELGYLNE
jgi:penicillin-binding protein 2